jgi:hypothetical protein
MPATAVSDLWVPQIWIRATDEKARTLPALASSGAFVRSPTLDSIASGGGTAATLPFFKDLTDTAEGIQVEGTEPTINAISSGQNVAPILNREVGYGANALAAGVSGDDPVGGITRQLGLNRQKRTQSTLLSVMRGLFNVAGAPAAAAQLSAARYDIFSETGASPTSDKLLDSAKFNLATALLGELQDSLAGGAIWMHPNIRAALLNQDENSFERDSRLGFMLETYKGFPLFVSNSLVRAGTTSGVVYDTYLLAAGSVGWGEKPQAGDSIDVASLSFYKRPDINQERIYDRRRYLVHVNGTKWVGTAAGQSATNAELAVHTNWSLQFQSADRCGIVCIRSNG